MSELSIAFINLINNITAPFWALIWAISSLLSLFWLYSLGLKMARSAVPGTTPVSLGEIAGVLFVVTLLASYSGTLNALSHSAGYGDIDFGIISYVDEGGQLGEFAGVINAALTFASLMGGVFGLKGLYLLRLKAQGENRGGDLGLQGAIHIFGGGALVQLANIFTSFSQSIK